MRGLRWSLVAAAALGALALAPAGASAAGCVQDNPGVPAGEPTEWTCSTIPVSVAGYGVKRGNLINIPKPPVSGGAITHMEVDVYDQNGAVPIDRLMLHHIVFLNANRNDTACGGPERFYGAGEERLKLSMPDGFGYGFNSSDVWATTYMYMNHRAQSDSAHIRYRLTIDPDPSIRQVKGLWMDAGDCQYDPIYNVPGIERPFLPDCKKLKKAANRAKTKRAINKAAKCVKTRAKREATIPADATHVETKDVTIPQDGILVAGAGHVHGGAKALTVTKPSCGNLEIARSIPTWGNANHPFYNVKPVLHEPGPIGMSAFGTETGIPIQAGQTLRLNSIYDDLQPHTRVMGIYVMYWAPSEVGDPADACGGIPPDLVVGPGTNEPGRTTPVPFTVPLTGIDPSGNAVVIDGPPGQFKALQNGSTVTVGDRFFSEPNVRITPGTTLNYRFAGSELHNLTLANGPLGIGSPDMNNGGNYSQTFSRSGTYRFFCGLHPVQMSTRVVVENPKRRRSRRTPRRASAARSRSLVAMSFRGASCLNYQP